MVPLTTKQNEDMTECKTPEHHFAGSLYEAKSKADLSTFLRLACWSPCTSTMTTTIKNNFLSTCPGLTEELVQKIPPKYEATEKGHIRQSFKGKQSTRPREPSGTPSQNPTRTHSVFLQVTNLAGIFYTDQTGRFPVTSICGFKYIMVAYEYYAYTIHAKPMKTAVAQNYSKDTQKSTAYYLNAVLHLKCTISTTSAPRSCNNL